MRASQFKFAPEIALLSTVVALNSTAQNLVPDQSFENGTIGGAGFDYGANNPYVTPAGSGWSFSYNSGLINQTDSGSGFNPPAGGAQSGSQFALLQGGNLDGPLFSEVDVPTEFRTASSISLSTGVTYELSFYQASRALLNGALTYAVKLSNDQTLFSRTSSTAEGWAAYSAQFTVPSTAGYELRFFAAEGQGDNTVFFDNISIAAVPEPAGFAAVFGLGLAGFAGWRKWQRG